MKANYCKGGILLNQLQIFNNPEFGQVRVLEKDGQPWFVANDVARALGYTNPSKATNDHCKKAITTWGNDSLGRRQEFKVIPEGDIYRLVIKSQLPSAEKFEAWVFDEVLPSIRQNGGYIANQENLTPEQIVANALIVAQNIIKQKDKLLEEQKPKVLFADAVSASHTSILVGDLAKLLRQNGIDIGANRLFEWLRENGYLIKRKGTDWNMPTQYSMDLGLFEIKERTINNPDGSIKTTKTPKVTGKGQQYFINKFLNAEDKQ
jgi:anti-repressor protein